MINQNVPASNDWIEIELNVELIPGITALTARCRSTDLNFLYLVTLKTPTGEHRARFDSGKLWFIDAVPGYEEQTHELNLKIAEKL